MTDKEEPMDPLSKDLRDLMAKYNMKYAVLICPSEDDTLQLALAGVSQEQVWMVCAELARRFAHNREPLNG